MNDKHSEPPRVAETLLRWLGAPDYIIGDFVEEFEGAEVRNGRFRANIWFWQQLLRSAPALSQRRWQTIMTTLTKRDKQSLILSAVLLIPAILVVISGLLFSLFGLPGPMNALFGVFESNAWLSWLIHPVAIMGGLALALLLTAWPVVRLEVDNHQDRLVGSLTIRKGYWLHMVVLGTAVFFVLLIFIYLFAENLLLFQTL